MKLIFCGPPLFLMAACEYTKRNVFNESDYKVFRLDSFDGKLERKIFYNIHDTSRKMEINYDFNGKILAKRFTYKGKQDGELKIFNINDRKLMVIDSFENGKKVFEKRFYKPDTCIKFINNGKEEKFESLNQFMRYKLPHFLITNQLKTLTPIL